MKALVDIDGQSAALLSDTNRMALCVERGDVTAPVAACPGWDLRKLAVHMGFIHRWATHAIANAAAPGRGDVSEPADDLTPEQLGAWLRAGADPLVEAFRAVDPTSTTWHPFTIEQKAWVWRRRQMIETALHRWDAETAVGTPSNLEPAVAADGIAEYFELGVPRILSREQVAVPTPSLHVHCTDADLPAGAGEWIVWNDDGEFRLEAEHRKGDAALRGSASDVLLVLMGRADTSTLDIVGDPTAAAAWLDLPGW